MRELFLGWCGAHVVVVIVVQIALATEIGGSLMLVGLTVLQKSQCSSPS
jgi:hypothetical protein